MLYLKESNFERAEETLRILLKMPTSPFRTRLSAINQFFNLLPHTEPDVLSKITDLYKIINAKTSRYCIKLCGS